jgi:regulator of cell morphogenesis and NO signaling
MMTLTATKTVRDYAIEAPQTIPVFEKLGIDFCCGGNRPLDEACAAANLNLDEVLRSLETALATPPQPSERQLRAGSLAELMAHIVRTHHAFVRREIPQIESLAEKVGTKHGDNHPELLHIRSIFRGVAQELTMHMMKEESVLFPFIERMEEAVIEHQPILPPPFGSIANPVRMMEQEHESAGAAFKAIREASHDYAAPADACVSFQAFYRELDAFEKDLHQHIHLENNVLFPRAIEMETSGRP